MTLLGCARKGRCDVPILTLLYAPGDRPDRVLKALGSPADVAAVDLEDAVAAPRKSAARNHTAELLKDVDRPVQVRINHPSTPWYAEDVAMVDALPNMVEARCPKVESADQVRDLASAMPGRALHLLVESALGVEHAFELATAAPEVVSIGLGEADLRSDLRVLDDTGLTWARSRIVTAARAAGLPSPLMSVYTNLHDEAGLVASSLTGRRLGFLGRAAIHPAQLAPIRDAFLPSPKEVERARTVMERVAAGESVGVGVFVLEDGSFLDRAMVEQARAVLDVAGGGRG